MPAMRAALPALALLAALLAGARPADAKPTGKYLVEAGGAVRGVRVIDADGDGRRDLVVLVETAAGGDEVVVLRTPATPQKRSLFPASHVTRIPCDGARADAGAVAVGRFGPGGAARMRFLGPRGIEELALDGTAAPKSPRLAKPTLLARSKGQRLVFWDAIADLDGDGLDETWFPDGHGDGAMRVLGGTPAGDRMLSIGATNRASTSHVVGMGRTAYVPNLFPADLDGDGAQELVALRDETLVGWAVATPAAGAAPVEPSYTLRLPFLAPDPDLGPEELRTARIQLEDVDGDGTTDLLVTVITGMRTNLLSIRTVLFHYPGPFRDPASGELVKPAARIDTQSIVLHPQFIDLDGDGAKEYVGDSIRGTMIDLIARLMGQDPKITYVAFRFDKRTRTFAGTPWFTIERLYASKEALNNTFGRAAWFEGDFDGDGRKDLLDLGNLTSVQVHAGAGDTPTFATALVPPVPVKQGLAADAQVADLNADGRADAVLWSGDKLFVILSKGGR